MADENAEGNGEAGEGEGSGEGEGEAKKVATETILGKESSDDGDKAKAGDEGDGEKAKADAGDDTDKKEGEGEGDGEENEGEKPGEFDTTKFEVPEGAEINTAWMDKLTGNDAIQKLNQGDVQGLIGMVGEFVNDRDNLRVETQNTRTAEWAEAYGKDAWVIENGGAEKVTPLAVAARDAFFPGMGQLLDETGLGSHPIMLVGMAKIAEALHILEGQLEGGGTAPGVGAKGNAAHRLFKDYAPGGKHAQVE